MSSILLKTAATAAHKTMPIPFKPRKLQLVCDVLLLLFDAQTRIQGMCTYSSSRIDGYQVHKQEDGYPSFTFY